MGSIWKGSAGHGTKQNRKSPATIASINKEYVQSLQQKIDRKKARKVRLYRRLTVFAIVALLMSRLFYAFVF